MYIQIKQSTTFVPTNFAITTMRIEEIIKSSVTMDTAKKVVLNLFYTQNVVTEKFNDVIKPYDLSAEQYNVLRILRGQKGNPVNMSLIQERMIAKNSNTTRLIDKLLLKDLVTREICPNNRRKMEILITQKGLDLLTKLDPKVLENEQHFAKNLDQQHVHWLRHQIFLIPVEHQT